MKQLRLTRIQVGGAGLAVLIGVAALFFLGFIRPRSADIARVRKVADDEKAYAATNGPKAKQALAAAKLREGVVKVQFDQIMKTRMPSVDLSDPIAGMFRLWRLPHEEGLVIDQWFRSTGAVVSGYSFPAFGTLPADPGLKVLPTQTWNLSVQVRDFPQLLEFLPKLTKAPRFMVMGDVTVQGPRQPGQPLTATLPVTLYEWTKAAQTALEAPGGAAAGPAGGAAGPPAGGPGGGGRRGGGGGMRGGGGGMRGGGGGMRGGGGGMRGGGGRG